MTLLIMMFLVAELGCAEYGMVWYQSSGSANALIRCGLSMQQMRTGMPGSLEVLPLPSLKAPPPFKPCPHRSQMAYGGDQHDRPYRSCETLCQLKEDFCQFNNSAVFNWQSFKALPLPQGGHHGREVFIVKGSHPRCYNIYNRL